MVLSQINFDKNHNSEEKTKYVRLLERLRNIFKFEFPAISFC